MRNKIGKIAMAFVQQRTAIMIVALAVASGVGGAYTYSRYISNATANPTAAVAKWAVAIKGSETQNGAFAVSFQEVANENVVNGKIAPGSKLSADFEIDPNGSEVAIDYSFDLGTITASTGSVPEGLAITKVCMVAQDNGETEVTKTGDQYKGTINLANQNAALTSDNKVKVRVYVEWTNSDDTEKSRNHTTVGGAAPTLTMPVTVTAQQHI